MEKIKKLITEYQEVFAMKKCFLHNIKKNCSLSQNAVSPQIINKIIDFFDEELEEIERKIDLE